MKYRKDPVFDLALIFMLIFFCILWIFSAKDVWFTCDAAKNICRLTETNYVGATEDRYIAKFSDIKCFKVYYSTRNEFSRRFDIVSIKENSICAYGMQNEILNCFYKVDGSSQDNEERVVSLNYLINQKESFEFKLR